MTPRRTPVFVACAAVVVLVMGWSAGNGFVYDDLPAIVQNVRVTDPSQWHTIPGSPYWLGTLWRPLTVAGFALQWWLGHGSPWVFHVVLLLGYLATGLALFALMRRLGIGELAAAATTLLFLAHPVHVEVVANGVGQAELWTALGLLAATAIYLRARRDGITPTAFVALLAVVTLAIAGKEQGFTAPLLLAAAEWLLLARRGEPLRNRLRLLVPVTALTLLWLVVRAGIVGSYKGESAAAAWHGVGFGGRIVTFLGLVPEYARLLVWPVHLQADYGPPGIPVGGPLLLRHWIGLALALGVIALFVRCRTRTPVVAFGLAWFAVTLAPVSNLLTATGIVMAERVLFLPSIGLAIALGGTLQHTLPVRGTANEHATAAKGTRYRGSAIVAALLAWGVLLAARSITRIPTWSSQRRFFTDIVVDAPLAYRAWKGAAEYWEGAGDHAQAIADLRRAMALWPHDHEVNERLGQFLRADGRCPEAIPVLADGLRLDPDVASLRAKLIECLIAERRWDDADRAADDAVARGQPEFEAERLRVDRLRRNAGAGSDRP